LSESKSEAGARLRTHLEAATRLRAGAMAERRRRDAVMALRRWQSERLARTYPDLLAHPRYRGPALFFFEELYGPKDLSGRDRDVQRILPTMTRLLPAAALSTIADAIELDALSESLDAAFLAALEAQGGDATQLTESSYADAYRACANRPERERQIAFVETIGSELEALTRVPLLEGTIRLMGGPAKAAGLSSLHNFLATGFSTFKKMGDAGEFLGTIVGRETLLMKRLFEGSPDPFAGLVPASS